MTLDDIKHSAERFAADELGFKYVIDARHRSPKLFRKVRAERISHLCKLHNVDVTAVMEQVDMFSL